MANQKLSALTTNAAPGQGTDRILLSRTGVSPNPYILTEDLLKTPVKKAGAITSQSLTSSLSSMVYNIIDYGATGDGTQRALSTKYGTLAAAQADYPFATALTQSLDWAATQLAMNLAAASKGGTVFSPPGVYMMSNELILPNIGSTDDGYNAVDIVGAGKRNTAWVWATDLGTGKYALRPNDMVNDYVRTTIRDIDFYGPRVADALGTAPANMNGIGTAHRMTFVRVQAEWFRSGVVIIGDHQSFTDCTFTKNYYGVYWGADGTNKGDHSFVNCDINGNKFANIGINPANPVDASAFWSCHLGFAPYGIYAESGTRTVNALSNTTFIDCAFEAIGNAIYMAQGTFDAYNGPVTCTFLQCSGTQNNTYKIAATAFTAFINADVDRCEFRGHHGLFGTYETAPAAIFGGKLTYSHLEDFRDLNYLSSTIALTQNAVDGSTFKNAGVEGFLSYVYDSAAVYGTVVGHWYESVGAMRAGSMVAGVILNTAPASYQYCMVATKGFAEVKKTSGVAITVNDKLQASSSTYGAVETATVSTRPLVGYAKFGAAAGDATLWIWIQITHRM